MLIKQEKEIMNVEFYGYFRDIKLDIIGLSNHHSHMPL